MSVEKGCRDLERLNFFIPEELLAVKVNESDVQCSVMIRAQQQTIVQGRGSSIGVGDDMSSFEESQIVDRTTVELTFQLTILEQQRSETLLMPPCADDRYCIAPLDGGR